MLIHVSGWPLFLHPTVMGTCNSKEGSPLWRGEELAILPHTMIAQDEASLRWCFPAFISSIRLYLQQSRYCKLDNAHKAISGGCCCGDHKIIFAVECVNGSIFRVSLFMFLNYHPLQPNDSRMHIFIYSSNSIYL